MSGIKENAKGVDYTSETAGFYKAKLRAYDTISKRYLERLAFKYSQIEVGVDTTHIDGELKALRWCQEIIFTMKPDRESISRLLLGTFDEASKP